VTNKIGNYYFLPKLLNVEYGLQNISVTNMALHKYTLCYFTLA